MRQTNTSNRTQQEYWLQNVISPFHVTVITNTGGLKSTFDVSAHTQRGLNSGRSQEMRMANRQEGTSSKFHIVDRASIKTGEPLSLVRTSDGGS